MSTQHNSHIQSHFLLVSMAHNTHDTTLRNSTHNPGFIRRIHINISAIYAKIHLWCGSCRPIRLCFSTLVYLFLHFWLWAWWTVFETWLQFLVCNSWTSAYIFLQQTFFYWILLPSSLSAGPSLPASSYKACLSAHKKFQLCSYVMLALLNLQ